MTRAERDKWVAELRSGRWRQGRDILVDVHRGKYCPIGVYFHAVKNYTLNLTGVGPIFKELVVPGHFYSNWLHALGLKSGQAFEITDLNDKFGKSFWEIADWIEQNVEVEP